MGVADCTKAYWGLHEKPFENTPDPRRTVFNNKLVKALITIVAIFPLGSLVKLDINEIGRVNGTSRMHLTRPKV